MHQPPLLHYIKSFFFIKKLISSQHQEQLRIRLVNERNLNVKYVCGNISFLAHLLIIPLYQICSIIEDIVARKR